jgi:LacI family transcriptional regulator
MYRVALIYNGTQPFDREVMRGVARYRHECGEFITYIEDDFPNHRNISDISAWDGDGIIGNFDSPSIAAAIIRSKLPAAAFGGWYSAFPRSSNIPYFLSNQEEIGRIAADHLLERGFQNFAFLGYSRACPSDWSGERQDAFVAKIEQSGHHCTIDLHEHDAATPWNDTLAQIEVWLKTLPKPVGILGAHDKLARHILEACVELGLRVPEDVAVVGVDNDELLCQLCTPELSSIEQAATAIGYQAAKLLHDIMRGQRPSTLKYVFDPTTLVQRKSSDFFAVSDDLVQRSIALIKANLARGVKVSDVVDAMAVSRSILEDRFDAALGTSVHGIIRKIQLQLVRQMVVESDAVMKEIAARAGFSSVQQMTTLFGKTYGKSPAKYRKDMLG